MNYDVILMTCYLHEKPIVQNCKSTGKELLWGALNRAAYMHIQNCIFRT